MFTKEILTCEVTGFPCIHWQSLFSLCQSCIPTCAMGYHNHWNVRSNCIRASARTEYADLVDMDSGSLSSTWLLKHYAIARVDRSHGWHIAVHFLCRTGAVSPAISNLVIELGVKSLAVFCHEIRQISRNLDPCGATWSDVQMPSATPARKASGKVSPPYPKIIVGWCRCSNVVFRLFCQSWGQRTTIGSLLHIV